jgi:hypothetical protein
VSLFHKITKAQNMNGWNKEEESEDNKKKQKNAHQK